MRVIVTAANGGVSHVIPLLPIAEILVARGHDVSFAVPEHLASTTRATGLPTDVVPTQPAVPVTAPASSAAWRPATMERSRAAVARYLGESVTIADPLVEICRRRGADLIVRETAAWAGWLVGCRLGLPVALFDYAPTPPRVRRAALSDLFRSAAGLFGLDPDLALDALGGDVRVLIGPRRWFGERVLDATTIVLQPPVGPVGAAPEWLDAPDLGPLVYVTFGSMFRPNSDLLRSFAAAAQAVPACFVASFGPDLDLHDVRRLLPANVRPVPFMPRDVENALLDRADLMLCHGGYGALLNAFTHALPVLCVPQHNADDPTRLAQLRRLGSALVLDESHRRSSDIVAAAHVLLTDPRYRAAARAVKDELTIQPEFEAVVPLIEAAHDRATGRAAVTSPVSCEESS